jgi:hypothetical protein
VPQTDYSEYGLGPPDAAPGGGTSGGIPQALPPTTPTYPTVPHPEDNPDAWAHLVIAGLPSPGLCSWSGCGRDYEWKENKATGKSGATVTGGTENLSDPTFTFKLWRRGLVDHIGDWNAWRPVLGTPDPKNPVALDCYHPALEQSGIRSVVVAHIGDLQPKGKGLWEVQIKLKEYNPAKSSGGTPSGSAAKNPNAPSGSTGSWHETGGEADYDSLAAESGGRVGDAVEAAVEEARAQAAAEAEAARAAAEAGA